MQNNCPKLYSVVLKVTNDCSLSCDYCYIKTHNKKIPKKIMPLNTIEKVIKEYSKIVDGEDVSSLIFTWHGGEPLLVGIEYYEKIMEMQKAIIPVSCNVQNSITTNGVNLNLQWIEFLKKNNFRTAVSLDGPQHIHDKHRVFPSGSGSFSKVIKGIELLKENKMDFGVLCVITEDLVNDIQGFFDFCLSNNILDIGFNPYLSNKKWLPEEKFTKFLIEIFDLWYELDNPNFSIREINDIIARIFGRKSSSCETEHCFGNHITIDINGDIFACDLLIGTAEMNLGNINEISICEVFSSEKYKNIKQRTYNSLQSCFKCNFFSICKGGCMYRRYVKNNNFSERDIYCETKKKVISHILNKFIKITNQKVSR